MSAMAEEAMRDFQRLQSDIALTIAREHMKGNTVRLVVNGECIGEVKPGDRMVRFSVMMRPQIEASTVLLHGDCGGLMGPIDVVDNPAPPVCPPISPPGEAGDTNAPQSSENAP